MSKATNPSANLGRFMPRTRRARGLALIAVLGVILTGLTFKNQVVLFLRQGDTIRADFSQNYDINPGKTRVKMAGLQIGVVSDLEQDDDGTAHVSMKIDHGVMEKLGSEPKARVEPLTILGGEYAIELFPGGQGAYTGVTIPVERSSTPVELDALLSALPSPTRGALQKTLKEAGDMLGKESARSLRGLSAESVQVMKPAGVLVTAVRGNRPESDIPAIVGNLENLATSVNSQGAALSRSLENLDRTTAALAARSPELRQTIANLPGALDATSTGTTELRATLVKLGRTSKDLQPTADRLKPLLDEVEPTLVDALPVTRRLPALLEDARPLVRQLVPIADNLHAVVQDVQGPVITRVRNPILSILGSTYRGTGAFSDTGGGVQANNKFYEEIGYMVTNLDRASQTHDGQGATLNFQAGVSAGTLGPLNLDDALAALLPILKGGN